MGGPKVKNQKKGESKFQVTITLVLGDHYEKLIQLLLVSFVLILSTVVFAGAEQSPESIWINSEWHFLICQGQ